MRTIFKTNLQLSLYKMKKRQYLTPAQKHNKFERANILLGALKAGTSKGKATVKNQNNRLFSRH